MGLDYSQKLIKNIRDKIAENDMRMALKLAQALLTRSPKLNEVLHQTGRFNELNNQIRSGLVSFEEASVAMNKLRYGILELLSEIEHQQYHVQEINREVNSASLKIYFIKTIILIKRLMALLMFFWGLILLYFRADIIYRIFQGNSSSLLAELFFPILLIIFSVFIYFNKIYGGFN